MKKLLIFALIISALAFCSAQAQSQSEPILYLEIEQTGLPQDETIGISIRVPVADASAAVTLRDEFVTRFFAGKTYTAKLHTHRTDAPCEVSDL